MRKRIVLLCAAVSLLLVGSMTGGLLTKLTLANPGDSVSIPQTINYQGLLTDKETGEPLEGTVDIIFSLYEVPSGGSPVWQETHSGVVFDNGLFNVVLGSINPINADNLTGESYLGVKVGTDEEMTPRQPLTSVPYAFHAENANTLDGLDSTDFMTSGNVKQLIHDFVVASGGNVTAGDVVTFVDGYIQRGFPAGNDIDYSSEYVFNSGTTAITSAAALSSTQFVVAYRDEGNSYYGTAIIGDVSGSTITYGTEYVFNSGTTSVTSASALSSTQFVVAY